MSKRKFGASSYLLLFFLFGLLVNPLLAQQQTEEQPIATVIYRLGKIELLRAGNNQWEFLKTGTSVSSEDIIRMPPRSVLRLNTKEHRLLPALTGCREAKISDLVELLVKQTNSGGRKIRSETGWIDGLTTGTEVAESTHQTDNKVQEAEMASPISKDINSLRAMFKNSTIRQIAQQYTQKISVISTSYPSRNILRAQELFHLLKERRIQVERKPTAIVQTPDVTWEKRHGTKVDYAVLYCSLLVGIGIQVDIKTTKDGQFLIFYDSGIPLNNKNQITANKKLVRARETTNKAWIPIYIDPAENDYTYAWYSGSKLAQE